MQRPQDYLQEIQKFTTSQYWNSGLRITSGVMVPMLIMAHQGWLSQGMPFLFGALFVSLTDTPGPIHHRRNGMLIALLLNTFTVFVTAVLHDYHQLLLAEVILFSFVFSLLGIYGARAGAIGTLALVIMLIHMSPYRQQENVWISALLTAGGGVWYTTFSLILYRLQPYRIVDQALGENILLIASYLRARALFYKAGSNVKDTFNRVMKEQVEVLKSQNQLRDLLFKTRQLVGDASPKSRSLMMIFLESLDLFEETMYSYQDYTVLQEQIPGDLLNQFYRIALQVVSELEDIGLAVQSGSPVKKMPALYTSIEALDKLLLQYKTNSKIPEKDQSVLALQQTLSNIRAISGRLRKIVQYSRMEAYDPNRFPDQELEKPAEPEPITVSLFIENLTLRSNYFRYSIRLTAALVIGTAVSALFSLSHAYWVMLTILTILKPVYNVTKARNIQRVLGTLGGVILGSAILAVLSNTTVLVVILTLSMLMAYSLLRVNYLGFVLFLTTYILITFHFLNPVQFESLIGERLIDTLIGSVIAALAARFIFPVWQQYNLQPAMKKMLLSNSTYFLAAWNHIKDPVANRKQYNEARSAAIIALTNLSDNFQQMLAEPGQSRSDASVHQFVIASHTLTSRISALVEKDITTLDDAELWSGRIVDMLQEAGAYIGGKGEHDAPKPESTLPTPLGSLHSLPLIYSLAHDIRSITRKMGYIKEAA